MNHFDDELKNALRRREAPQGFADRVLARAAQQASQRPRSAWRNAWRKIFAQPFVPWIGPRTLTGAFARWAAVAAVSAALVVGGVHYRNVRRERAQGEAAKERLLLALRIAGSKLQLARTRVDQINSDEINSNENNSGRPENQQERE